MARRRTRKRMPRDWSADDHFDPKKVAKKICDYITRKGTSLYNIKEALEAVHWGGIQDLTRDGTGMLSRGTRFAKGRTRKIKPRSKRRTKRKARKRVRRTRKRRKR